MEKLVKYVIATLLFVNLTNGINAQNSFITDKAYKANWRLVFSEEFDSAALNTQKWRNSFPWGRWTHGLHYSTDGGNFLFDQSQLNISTRQDTITGIIDTWDSLGNYKPYYKHFDYTSGMIYTNRSFKYGYFESRIKAPATKGLNSAFWLYGPDDCEIDVFEILGSKPHTANMTLHWKNKDIFVNSTQSIFHTQSNDSTFAEKDYTFGIKWKPKELVWYLDNKEIKGDPFTRFIRSRHIPDVNMNVIFTCEVGTMDGPPDQSSAFPALYNIDYFRAYSDDTIPPPVISGQKPLTVKFPSALSIVPGMLMVNDYYKTYPAGFKIEIMPGSNYMIKENAITPLSDAADTLYVPVRVNDGIDTSPIYTLKIAIFRTTPVQPAYPGKDLIIFPNPVKQILYLNTDIILGRLDAIDIFDARGIKYIHILNPEQGRINVSSLRKGLYFISVTTFKGKHTLKFIKE